MAQSITLDCAPGGTRPGDLIAGVLADTGLTEADFSTGTPFFGEQVWTLKDPAKEPTFLVAQATYKERVTALYHAGAIRYGDW